MQSVASGADLNAAMSLCMSAVETRTTIPELGYIRLKAGENSIELSATDMEIQIKAQVPSLTKQTGSIAIPAKIAHAQLRSIGGGDINLSADYKSMRAVISHNGLKSRLVGIDAASCHDLQEENATETMACEIAAADLLFALRSVQYCCTDGVSKWAIPAVHFSVIEGEATTQAMDGDARLSTAKCPCSVVMAGSVLIPRKAVAAIIKLVSAHGGDVQVRATKRLIHVSAGSAQIWARLTEGRFPDFSRVMPDVTKRSRVMFSTARMIEALQCAVPFALDGSMAAKVKLNFEDGITVSSSGFNSGELDARVEAEGEYQPIAVHINATFLLDFLRSHDEEYTSVYPGEESKQPMEFRPGDGSRGNYRCLIAMMWQ